MTDVATHYLEELRRQFRGHRRLAEGAISPLKDEELSSSLIQKPIRWLFSHMADNMRSRFTDFLTADGEKPDRHRDQEFEMKSNPSRQELMSMWEAGWAKIFSTLAR
jgi:Protein of unknown function (DUF1572)